MCRVLNILRHSRNTQYLRHTLLAVYITRQRLNAMTDLKIPLKEVERHGRKHTVLLTGGTSYVAGHILHRLLANGIHVHATVRDPSDESKIKHLRSLPNGKTHLKFFKSDLLKVVSIAAYALQFLASRSVMDVVILNATWEPSVEHNRACTILHLACDRTGPLMKQCKGAMPSSTPQAPTF